MRLQKWRVPRRRTRSQPMRRSPRVWRPRLECSRVETRPPMFQRARLSVVHSRHRRRRRSVGHRCVAVGRVSSSLSYTTGALVPVSYKLIFVVPVEQRLLRPKEARLEEASYRAEEGRHRCVDRARRGRREEGPVARGYQEAPGGCAPTPRASHRRPRM